MIAKGWTEEVPYEARVSPTVHEKPGGGLAYSTTTYLMNWVVIFQK